MKMIVVTTITTTLDIDTMNTKHTVDIDDQDGLSNVSTDVLGGLLLGAVRATEMALRKQFPLVDRLEKAQPITDDEY